MIEKRLWQQSQSRRGLLVASVLCGVFGALTILGQAFILANILHVVFLEQAALAVVLPRVGQLLFLVTLRFLLQTTQSHLSFLLGQGVQTDLRLALLQKMEGLGPLGLYQEQRGRLLYLLNEGIATLESYFRDYLPQLFQSLVIPMLFFVLVLPRDWPSAFILLITAPLVPFFMILIGKWTNKVNARQWKIINRLSSYLHDVMAGLTTLKLFNRSQEQGKKIASVSTAYADATLAVLRWAFLSSLALELLTTISIALVAVGLGLRLVAGELDFATAFFILLIAPEFYQPLRALGAHFHTSLNAKEAADAIYAFLAQPDWVMAVPIQPQQAAAIAVTQLTVCYPGAETPALQNVTLTVQPGEIVALVGRSGSGKTTLFNVLQGYLQPQSGSVCLQAHPAAIRQKPYLFAGTILENLCWGEAQLSEAEVMQLCQQTGLCQLLQHLPDGLQTVVGQGGVQLSGGQRQLVAMVRSICQKKQIVLLDEATAHLDLATEQELQQSLRLLLRGRTVLMAVHRLNTLQLADRVIVLERGRIVQEGSPAVLCQVDGPYRRLLEMGVES